MQALGGYLKQLRERSALAQAELSRRANLSETYYGKIELGQRLPSAGALMAILGALDATPEQKTEAIRIFAQATGWALLIEVAYARPQRGTAPGLSPAAVPSRRSTSRRKAARLALALLSMAWASDVILPPPAVASDHQVPLIGRWRRRLAAVWRRLSPLSPGAWAFAG